MKALSVKVASMYLAPHASLLFSLRSFALLPNRRNPLRMTHRTSATAQASSFNAAAAPAGAYANMSIEQLHDELLRHGRRRAEDHHASIAPLLDELITRPLRNAERIVRDGTLQAHNAALHSRCTELYLAASKHESVVGCTLHEAIVDSVVAQHSPSLMLSVVAAAARRLENTAALLSQAGKGNSALVDAITEVSMYRAFWLCALQHVELEQEILLAPTAAASTTEAVVSHKDTTTSSPQQRDFQTKMDAYREAAERIYSALQKVNSRFDASFSSPVAPLSAGNWSMSSVSSERSPAAADNNHMKISFGSLWDSTRRFVRYNYATDGGEAHFYLHCYRNRYFTNRHSASTVVSLMRSTSRSQNTDLLKLYFSEHLAAVSRAVDDGVDAANGISSRREELQEVVVHTYLQNLVNCRAFSAVVDVSVKLLGEIDGYTPSNSVITVMCRAAGETRNEAVALQAANLLFRGVAEDAPLSTSAQHNPRVGGSSRRRVIGGRDVTIPTPYEVFLCLVSLAKCHAPNFLALLSQTQRSADVAPSAEEALYLKLHYMRRSPCIEADIREVLRDIELKPLASAPLLTVRNMTMILVILQVSLHSKFFQTLQDFYKRSSERRTLWLVIYCQWYETVKGIVRSATQTGELVSDAQRTWVLRELKILLSASSVSKNRNTNSLWHLLHNSIASLSTAEAQSQRGAAAAFLADCCQLGHISYRDAFGANEPMRLDDSVSFRFVKAPKKLITRSLRCGDDAQQLSHLQHTCDDFGSETMQPQQHAPGDSEANVLGWLEPYDAAASVVRRWVANEINHLQQMRLLDEDCLAR